MISNLNLNIKCHVLWKWILCCTWTNCFHTLKTIIHTRNLITHVHRNYANHIKPWFKKFAPPALQMNAIWKWTSVFLFCLVLPWIMLPDNVNRLLNRPDDMIWVFITKKKKSWISFILQCSAVVPHTGIDK